MTAWKLAYHANCWGALGGDAVGVTSITQLAYRTFGAMDRALSDIAAAGYQGVELFDGTIEAQKAMVNSPNHTVVYIPSGPMGVPITGTFPTVPAAATATR